MAVIEVQIRKTTALAGIKDDINGRRLPFPTFPPLFVAAYPSLTGASLQRIECLDCTMDASDGDGQVTVHAPLVFHHNRLPEAKAAGSLQAPVTHEHRSTLALELSVVVPVPATPGQPPSPDKPALRWSAPFGLFGGSTPIGIPAGTLPGAELSPAVGAVEANDNVVALRIGTDPHDPVNGPIHDHVGEDDWSLGIPGRLLADVLAAGLHEVLHVKLPAGIVVDRDASGEWYPAMGMFGMGPFPGAIASATLHVQHECVFGIVIPVDLSLSLLLEPSGPTMVQTVQLFWRTDSALCDLVGGSLFFPILPLIIDALIGNAVSAEILGAGLGPGHGFTEIDRGDSSVTYRRTAPVAPPVPRGVVTRSEVGPEGLRVWGVTTKQPPPLGLTGEVTPPTSGLDVDCGRRSVSVKFSPPGVTLRDIGIDGGVPRLFPGRVWFEPPGAWQVTAGPSNTWLDLSLTFAEPPGGHLPAGTATSVYLHTDCGLRWADLGVIPADHPEPTTADRAMMISRCMAISDPWGLGVMNLHWLIDPPDLALGAVRQWSLGFQDLPASVQLEFVAIGPDGTERHLGVVEGHRSVAVELATDADETLQVRAGRALAGAAPVVLQRWVVPFVTAPLDDATEAVASSGGVIGLRDRDGLTRLVDAGPDGRGRIRVADSTAQAEPAFHRLQDALNLERRRGLGAWATTARVSAGLVAVTHRGRLLIGGAGPAVRL